MHNAFLYMCLEALSAMFRASEVLCILDMLLQMNPLAGLQIGGKQKFCFPPQEGRQCAGTVAGVPPNARGWVKLTTLFSG